MEEWEDLEVTRAPSLPLLVRARIVEVSAGSSREEVNRACSLTSRGEEENRAASALLPTWSEREGEEWVLRRRAEVVVRRAQPGGRGWGPNPLLEGRRERPHSVELGNLRGRWLGAGGSRGGSLGHPGSPRGPWWGVVPCTRVRHRQCDELPEEFTRAGIGACFRGGSFIHLIFCT